MVHLADGRKVWAQKVVLAQLSNGELLKRAEDALFDLFYSHGEFKEVIW